jgi:hypothetical protein
VQTESGRKNLHPLTCRDIISAMGDDDEQAWCDDQRSIVIDYLVQQGLEHGEVGEWPAWHIAPHVAIWAVESVVRPGWVGWWVISGDLPTDYMSCGSERHPRAGLRAIAERWRDAAPLMAEGKDISGWNFGSAANRTELAPLLAARADALLSFTADDTLWAA